MPFVIRYPREIAPGAVLDEIVLNIDFAELFLDYAGVAAPPTMRGRSFRRNVGGSPPTDWRDAMYYHYWTHQKERPSHYGIRTRRYKLIWYPVGNRFQLFDLESDPQEMKGLAGDPRLAEVRERLTDLLVENLYGEDLAWVRDGKLVGAPDKSFEPFPSRDLCRQRGLR